MGQRTVTFGAKLERRINSLPEFFRPIAYGAVIILVFMGARGALFIIPIAIVYVAVTSSSPLSDLEKGASFLLLAVLGGALSGLSYSLLGKHVRRLGTVGAYLAGIVTITPYMWVLIHLGLNNNDPLLHHIDLVDYGFVAVMSIIFGSMLGHLFRKKDEQKAAAPGRAT
jgi:hypothetical protein